MRQPEYTAQRYTILQAVRDGQVRFHYGLSGPALGYTWSETVGGQMHQYSQRTLQELHDLNLIDVDNRRLFAQRGCRVIATRNGSELLYFWSQSQDSRKIA